MFVLKGIGIAAAAIGLAGCASFNGTRPQDMTGMEHARAAESAAARGRTNLAAAHRYAARELEEQADVACRGVAQSQIAPDLTGLSVGSVSEIELSHGEGSPTVVGARLLVALEGRALETTGRLIQCRAARAAIEGGDTDPFAVSGASARVSPGDAGWAVVEIRGPDTSSGEEIVRRVRAARAP